jgi:hypothetical protein
MRLLLEHAVVPVVLVLLLVGSIGVGGICSGARRAGSSPFGASVAEIMAIGHWRLEERCMAAELEKEQAQSDVLVAADTGGRGMVDRGRDHEWDLPEGG